jgi:TldD protein
MGLMTRRKFVTLGAQGIALAAIPGFLRFNPTAAFALPTETGKLAEYYAHFGVDEAMINELMATALSHGGDYCDVFFQHSIGSNTTLEDDKVSRATTSVDLGVGIRVLKGDQTGYSFTEELTPESMKLAAKTAANIAASGSGTAPAGFKYRPTPDYYSIQVPWENLMIDKKIPVLQKVNEKMAALDTRLVKRRVSFSDNTSYMLVATSDGKVMCDYQPMTQLTASCTAEQNGRRESSYSGASGRRGMEFYTDDLLDRLAREAVADTLRMFDAVKPEAGEMPVVLGAGHSGILLHEAIGHGMEADSNRKNESVYADKIGKPIAQSMVTIVDDGTNPNLRGSINVDDEANDSQRTVLVENGILKTYMHDRISANHYGVAPTGNGRRQSFRFNPLPRMRNTYMLNGPHTREEIISSVKKGLYCESFTNGEVRIGPGDFTFYVQSGNLIEDGKLTAPVKDVNIIGNGPQVLERVTMVANDFAMSDGTWGCGKGGQFVPVTLGQPTVLVSAITVGGVS